MGKQTWNLIIILSYTGIKISKISIGEQLQIDAWDKKIEDFSEYFLIFISQWFILKSNKIAARQLTSPFFDIMFFYIAKKDTTAQKKKKLVHISSSSFYWV